ncbi:MAG TPA: HlyC/CorC family transporter [Acholeplasmataceae bacterium]|nr:HlyC/CorC family transporter [Acholeplasmataceae bacterium]
MVPPELPHSLAIDYFLKKPEIHIILLVLFICLFFFSGFLSKAEAVFSSVNIIRIRSFLEERKRGAKKAVYVAEKYDVTLMTLLIVNIFLKLTLVALAGYFLYNLLDNYLFAFLLLGLIVSPLLIVFTELIPKAKGQIAPEMKALKYSGILYLLMKILSPFTFLYVKLRRAIIRKHDLPENRKVTEEELESIIDAMETEGVFEENDAEMIQNAISLSDTTVYDIMTPRVDVVAVEISTPIEEIKDIFFEHQFSRIPVYREDKDNIVGILSEKDFFTALLRGEEFEIEKLLSEPYYVSKTTKVNDLIKEMQRLKKHFAIVVDDYGGTSGIVTMEDALEEIVGEIYDEYDDVEEEELVKISENRYHVKPDMDLEELFEILELGNPPESEFSSVGGFVYGLCEGMPYEGMEVSYVHKTAEFEDDEEKEVSYTLKFTVSKVANRRIQDLQLEVSATSE